MALEGYDYEKIIFLCTGLCFFLVHHNLCVQIITPFHHYTTDDGDRLYFGNAVPVFPEPKKGKLKAGKNI